MDDVDLRIVGGGRELLLETKCHLDEPEKKLFLVNSRAHERSQQRGADGFIPIISLLAGTGVFVGRVIPIDDVERWGVKTWLSRPELDPARAASLTGIATKYFSWPYPWMRARLRNAATCTSPGEVLWPAYESGLRAFATLVTQRPDWSSLGYADLVRELAALDEQG